MTTLDTGKMWKHEVNPGHRIQVHRIFCDAQYKCPEATRVLTRINMMQRLGRVRTGKRRNRVTQAQIAQAIILQRSLGISLRAMRRDGRVRLLKLLYRAKRMPKRRTHVKAR